MTYIIITCFAYWTFFSKKTPKEIGFSKRVSRPSVYVCQRKMEPVKNAIKITF